MEKIENELIAEFMGIYVDFADLSHIGQESLYIVRGDYPFLTINGMSTSFKSPRLAMDYFCRDAKYDTSWDWLMPVVEKIVQLKGSHLIYDHTVLEIFMWGKSIVRIRNATIFQNYHRGVVEFIRWYNSQKQ